ARSTGYHQFMATVSRRSLLLTAIAARLVADGNKGRNFPAESQRYQDPTTELEVFRLTDPAYSSLLPAYYNRVITRNSASLMFCCDRSGSIQIFRMDLKTAATRQLTDAEELDPASVTLTPDNRSLCYFAGRSIYVMSLSTMRDKKLY